MSPPRPGDAATPATPAPRAAAADDSRYVLFWLHQLIEYLVAVGVGWMGARAHGTAQVVLLAAAVAIGLLAAVSDGALGAGRLVDRRLHRVLDGVLVVALAAVAIALMATDEVTAGVVVLGIAALMAFLFRRTRYERRPPGPRRTAAKAAAEVAAQAALAAAARRGRPPADGTASRATSTASTASTARALGRLAGRAREATRGADRPAGDPPGSRASGDPPAG